MLRYFTAGESHGKALVSVIEGLPAGIPIDADDINRELQRRQHGYGRGGRMKIEQDKVEILTGIRGGYTLGSPVTLCLKNKDWENWENYMAAEPDIDLESKKVTNPRPGHVDLAGAIKYGFKDVRNVLERSSARETAMRVAVGAVAKKVLNLLSIDVFSHVVAIGNVNLEQLYSYEEIKKQVANSPVFCVDTEVSNKMIEEIKGAKEKGDTLGGIIEIIVRNVPIGIGSYVHWDRKLDGMLAQALISIQAIKSVEFGLGFAVAQNYGSKVHDEIKFTQDRGIYHETNNAGGIEGGVSNGEPIVIKVAMKPIPTLMQPLKTIDLQTKKEIIASTERSDVCAVPAASVVSEAVVAFTILNAILEKFGGDTFTELKDRFNSYKEYLKNF